VVSLRLSARRYAVCRSRGAGSSDAANGTRTIQASASRRRGSARRILPSRLQVAAQFRDNLVERPPFSGGQRPQDFLPPVADDRLEVSNERLAFGGHLHEDLPTIAWMGQAADVAGDKEPVHDAAGRRQADMEAAGQCSHRAAGVGVNGEHEEQLRLSDTALDEKVELDAPDDVRHQAGDRQADVLESRSSASAWFINSS